jgi:pimeloyl-ACP methyl ester carboxylesterase
LQRTRIEESGHSVRHAVKDLIRRRRPTVRDTEFNLLFVTPPVIAPADRDGTAANYLAQQAHYIQVWNIVNLYDDVLWSTQLPRVPAMVVWGELDRIFDVPGARALQRAIPEIRRYQMSNAGHPLHVERAEDVVAPYAKFLRDVAGPTSASEN